MAYPYSPAETIADGAVHIAGLAFAIPATVLLLMQAAQTDSSITAAALYGGCLIFAFAASAIYHLSPYDRTRPLLNRIDHAAIYFKIAGTYTPLVGVIGTGFAYGILGVVWTLAGIGALAKLWFWRTDARGSLALYLAMGWLSVLLIWPMWAHLPPAAMSLVVIGGLTYSLGTIVFAQKAMRFQNAIWHSFVLIASICFFAAIALSL
ncbi:hemolysin III [Sulfitobacter brevis]|uniref:Hemolysin III n=1 Tax=Sulfitobacter brevis TaxID=74348 RepID=A0A1I1WVV5_9RHOB|nr:hemolysin III family protein [Sulfitobacter brevis]SFD99172.1 hemolysin III [Sulfitobacter brevis]